MRADAVVVFDGPDYPARFRRGMQLAQGGAAPFLVISTTPAFVGTNRCLSVPGVRVLCFLPDPLTTQGEAREIRALATRYGWRSVVLVTTRFQATRARLRVERCFAGEVHLSPVSPRLRAWPRDIAYEWGATAKALFLQRSC